MPATGISTQERDDALHLLHDRLDRTLARRLDDGDFAANLFHHLRTRTSPRMPFSPDRLPLIAARCAAHEPEAWNWEAQIAQHAVEGRVYAASHPHCDRFIELDEAFDFSAFDHPDPQAIHGLNRTRWFDSLAHAYWLEQDPACFDALMRHWDFYAARVPIDTAALFPRMHGAGHKHLPPPHHELDTFIRLTNWWWAFWLSLHAAPMAADRCCVLLARCLRLFDLVAARGIKMHKSNFTAMQMEALYLWAGSLPEVTGMDAWRTHARNTAEASLMQAALGDGVHWEKSISYHGGCVRWYGVPFLLARQWGEPWADECADRLARMGAFLDAVVLPDGTLPLLSDSDRDGNWHSSLSLVRCIFPATRFRHPVGPSCTSLWITDGEEWNPQEAVAPQPAATVFSEGGIAIARDDTTAAMLILDNGPSDAGHSHYDNLTVHYTAFGRPVLTDPGRAFYRPDADRAWVLHPCSHNTVWLEDQEVDPAAQLPPGFDRVPPGDPRIGPTAIETKDGAHRIDSTFAGFTADATARVHRRVYMPADGRPPWLAVVDRLEAEQEHRWTHSWLLPTASPVAAVPGGFNATFENGLQLAFSGALDGLDLRDDAMFWFPNYGEKLPARWLRFSSRLRTGLRAFVFCPHEGERPAPSVRLDGNCVVVTVDGKDQTLEAPA